MDHNGVAVPMLREFVAYLRATPEAGAVTATSSHHWQHGPTVDWHAGTVTIDAARVDRDHQTRVDLPTELGGHDRGPTPSELLSAALGACVAQRLVELAADQGVDLRHLEITCTTELNLRGTYRLGDARPGLTGAHLAADVAADVAADAEPEVLEELLATAVATSPIADTVAHPVALRASLRR